MSTAHPTAASWRRCIAMLVPMVMPLAMKAVFGRDHTTIRRCTRLPGRLRHLLGHLLDHGRRDRRAPASPRPLATAQAGAGHPSPLAVAVRAAVAVAAGIGVTNAYAEEALWRGVPLATFPNDTLRGWLWPAAGFIVWHLVPLSSRPATARRRASLLGGAAAIGLGYGWIAQQTQSLAVITPSHALTDSCGVRPARSIWLTRGS